MSKRKEQKLLRKKISRFKKKEESEKSLTSNQKKLKILVISILLTIFILIFIDYESNQLLTMSQITTEVRLTEAF